MAGITISTASDAKPEKIKKVVYLAAFLLKNGTSVYESTPRMPDSKVPKMMKFENETIRLNRTREGIIEAFYHTSRKTDIELAMVTIYKTKLYQ